MRHCLALLLTILATPLWAQNKVNPDISLNTLFTYKASSLGNNPNAETANGFSLQEAELRLTSNIDTYFRGDVILAVESNESKSNPGEPEYVVEPEEVFVDTLNLPGMMIRAGKFYPYWGRTNQRHTHSLAFIDAPQTRTAIFGDEGFNETGIAASYLLPTPWYFELIAQVFSAENEAVFGSPSRDDVAGVLFVKNLWELTDSSTFEIDLSYATGHAVNEKQNHIYNTALTYKCKCSNHRSFVWTAEYTLAEQLFDDSATSTGRTSALSTWLKYQLTNRWWAQARHEVIDKIEDDSADNVMKSSALVAFVASEYSAIRFQYDNIDNPTTTDNEQIYTLQLNLTMGAHPAHDY